MDRRTLIAATGALGTAFGAGAARAGPGDRLTPTEAPIPTAFILGSYSTMIDFAGPWEAFQDASVFKPDAFMTYTVSDSRNVVRTSGSGGTPERPMGMKVIPDFTFDDAPAPKVVVMGAQNDHTEAKLNWIRRVAPDADVILSVCTGAFLLAKTGLLDGLTATTHHQFYESFEQDFPRVRLVRDRRFVDNGKFVSAGGLTSGVDGALHVVARYFGEEAAQKSADYMEHYGTDWKTGVPTRG